MKDVAILLLLAIIVALLLLVAMLLTDVRDAIRLLDRNGL